MAMYDFDFLPQRDEFNSSKWAQRNAEEAAAGVIPMTTADMDFLCPPCVVEAVKNAAAHGVYGYTGTDKAYFDSLAGWMKRRHGWEIKQEWVTIMPGVVVAMSNVVRCFTKEGEGVLILKPGYPPFSNSTAANGRVEVISNLVRDENNRYSIDFDDLRKKAADPNTKLMFMCSPHNPVGRIWSKEELHEVAKICAENHVILACDEIHHDLQMKNCHHTTIALAAPEYMDNIIVFTAPSKTFNLAGLQLCNIFTVNPEFKSAIDKRLNADGLGCPSYFGVAATTAAYREGDGWLDALMEKIEENFNVLKDFLAQNIPQVRLSPLEGTYLAWTDWQALGQDEEKLTQILRDGGALLTGGTGFGASAPCFYRVNLALPTPNLVKALEGALAQLKKAGVL